MIKEAFGAGALKAVKNTFGKVINHPHFTPGMEIGGLGMLAAPSVATLAGHKPEEKTTAGAELAGLGTLAVPSALEMMGHHPSGGSLFSKLKSFIPKHAEEGTTLLRKKLREGPVENIEFKAPKHQQSWYPKEQLSKGMTVEKEHTDSPIGRKIISENHIDEDKKYYNNPIFKKDLGKRD